MSDGGSGGPAPPHRPKRAGAAVSKRRSGGLGGVAGWKCPCGCLEARYLSAGYVWFTQSADPGRAEADCRAAGVKERDIPRVAGPPAHRWPAAHYIEQQLYRQKEAPGRAGQGSKAMRCDGERPGGPGRVPDGAVARLRFDLPFKGRAGPRGRPAGAAGVASGGGGAARPRYEPQRHSVVCPCVFGTGGGSPVPCAFAMGGPNNQLDTPALGTVLARPIYGRLAPPPGGGAAGQAAASLMHRGAGRHVIAKQHAQPSSVEQPAPGQPYVLKDPDSLTLSDISGSPTIRSFCYDWGAAPRPTPGEQAALRAARAIAGKVDFIDCGSPAAEKQFTELLMQHTGALVGRLSELRAATPTAPGLLDPLAAPATAAKRRPAIIDDMMADDELCYYMTREPSGEVLIKGWEYYNCDGAFSTMAQPRSKAENTAEYSEGGKPGVKPDLDPFSQYVFFPRGVPPAPWQGKDHPSRLAVRRDHCHRPAVLQPMGCGDVVILHSAAATGNCWPGKGCDTPSVAGQP